MITEEIKKMRYEAPVVVELGKMARGSGGCSAGSSVQGSCSSGGSATNCTAGTSGTSSCGGGSGGPCGGGGGPT